MNIVSGVISFLAMIAGFVGVTAMAFTDWEPTQNQIGAVAFLALVYGAGAAFNRALDEV